MLWYKYNCNKREINNQMKGVEMTKQTKRVVGPTLHVVRYTTQELIDFITQEFYENVGTCTQMYFLDKAKEQKQIRPRTRYEQRIQRIKDIEFRIDDYKQRREKETKQEDKDVYTDGINILSEKLELEKNFDIPHQKAEYEKTGDVFASRSFTEFPLNKLLNSLYDEFNAIVLYYDNLTNDEIITKLENAPTLEEKVQIVKDNVEITHMLLSLRDNTRASIALMGKLDPNYSDYTKDSAQILPPQFADFGNTTLAESAKIKNNDLAQLIQEHLDLEKENLKTTATLVIKGEEYNIKQSPDGTEFIRYVCPSTQRVYYNALNFDYLKESQYFKYGDAESYIKAWYSVANLFIELTEDEISRPSIAC